MSKRGICMAPMIDITNRYFRYLIYLIEPEIYTFTEMIRSYEKNIIHDYQVHKNKFLCTCEAAQIIGKDVEELKKAAIRLEELGFKEINFNIGCPGRTVNSLGCGIPSNQA